MHKTDAGERRKALRSEARDLEREAKILAKTKQTGPTRRIKQEEADRLKAEAEALKDTARLEDLHIWQMEKEKTTKKGPRTYTYWMASWREGNRVRNVHLGNCMKMDVRDARQKAIAIKAQALAIKI